MKNSVFVLICIFVVLVIANPSLGLAFLIIAAFIGIIVNYNKNIKPQHEANDYNEHLPHPGYEYSFYHMVGMQYRDLDKSDLGIHTCALAIAENNNPHDPYAVAIYRNELGIFKLVGYVPADENRELHDYINKECNGRTLATYKIWPREDKLYGITYIKDR